MSERFRLNVTSRDIVGKKVKQYRRNGQIPGVVYGPQFEPVKIFVNESELRTVLTRAGGTHLIELGLDGTEVTALAREVQRDPIKGSLTHVDFYRVAMDRMIRTAVPITITGTSPAVSRREAIVLQPMTVIEIEVLPADLPDHIEVDISELAKVGDHILVSDLKLGASMKVIAAPEDLVVRLDYAEAAMAEDELAAPVTAEVEVITAKKEEEEDAG